MCSSMLAGAESVICRVKEAPHMRLLAMQVLLGLTFHEFGTGLSRDLVRNKG